MSTSIPTAMNRAIEEEEASRRSEFPCNMRVLAVASPTVLDDLRVATRECLHEVSEATTAKEALDLLQKHPGSCFDMLLVDLNLPDMKSSDFLNKIHELQPDAGLVASSSNRILTVMKAVGLHACCFLAKPLQNQDVQHIQNKILKKTPALITSSGTVKIPTKSEKEEAASGHKTKQYKWNMERQEMFKNAVQQLGGLNEAIPKELKKIMAGLGDTVVTKGNISSYLQKARLKELEEQQSKKAKQPHTIFADAGMFDMGQQAMVIKQFMPEPHVLERASHNRIKRYKENETSDWSMSNTNTMLNGDAGWAGSIGMESRPSCFCAPGVSTSALESKPHLYSIQDAQKQKVFCHDNSGGGGANCIYSGPGTSSRNWQPSAATLATLKDAPFSDPIPDFQIVNHQTGPSNMGSTMTSRSFMPDSYVISQRVIGADTQRRGNGNAAGAGLMIKGDTPSSTSSHETRQVPSQVMNQQCRPPSRFMGAGPMQQGFHHERSNGFPVPANATHYHGTGSSNPNLQLTQATWNHHSITGSEGWSNPELIMHYPSLNHLPSPDVQFLSPQENEQYRQQMARQRAQNMRFPSTEKGTQFHEAGPSTVHDRHTRQAAPSNPRVANLSNALRLAPDEDQHKPPAAVSEELRPAAVDENRK